MKLSPLPLIGFLLAALLAPAAAADSPAVADRVFELRIYHPHEGKLDDLLARFRDHTCGIFARLGAENIGYWVETEPKEGAEPKLYYVIAHPSREAAKEFWQTFLADEEWKRISAASRENGWLVKRVDSIFMAPTDFSEIK